MSGGPSSYTRPVIKKKHMLHTYVTSFFLSVYSMPFFPNYKNKKLKKLIKVLFTSQFFVLIPLSLIPQFFCNSDFSVCLALTGTYV